MSYENEGLPTNPTPEEMIELKDRELLEARAEILRDLRAGGITRVEAEYDGSGDSGQINGVGFYIGDTETADPGLGVEDFMYRLLEEYGLNGFDNEGSSGTIKWDLTRDIIFMHHGWVVESYEDDSKIIGPGPTPDRDVA